ncbi:tetratricopeptide repeat protein [Emticicia soli]|uniref:Tetratricopeptide repeat protein n=1 Tax=Emticicia soli TaxID=2027878 RepID=A0ABW5JAX1_9BACT
MKNPLHYILCLSILLFSCQQKSNTNKDSSTKPSMSVCSMPEVIDKQWYSLNKKAPLLSGLEGISFPVTTKSAEAQKYFNQGLMLAYGFNHAEAARSFYEVVRQDSTCAMGWWGFANVLGPNYNAGMEPDNFERAYEAVQKAKALSANCTPKEKDLIQALSQRYVNDATIARATLDASYMAAMRNVYKKYPTDVDVATLFAESIMDLHPWQLWKPDGSTQPWTPEIIAVLEKALQINPKHAGANHFYIHAQEMSQNPGKALVSAKLLETLVPGAGHLVHMPSHTYIRIGKYHEGVLTNQQASLVDSLYVEACHAQGAYPLGYYPHNYHFIAACGTLSGESKSAITGAIQTANHAHKKLMLDPAWGTLQHYYTIPWYVQVKLGLWNDILQAKAPEENLKYPVLIWYYAQAMAVLSQNKVDLAKQHLAQMKAILKDSTLKNLTIWNINNVYDLSVIATKIVEGEISAKEKNYTQSIVFLKEAVAKEDALNYNEPADWFFSVRHHLGAVLIDAGKYAEAIKVYEQDLKTYPENGWVLKGLMNAYSKTGDKKNYEKVKQRFDEAWKFADIKIASSRIL